MSPSMPVALDYLVALARINLRAGFREPWVVMSSVVIMVSNNLIFYVVWVIYFSNFSNLQGWQLKDLALLLGIVAWGLGISMLFGAGARDLARLITDGELDVHLGRPHHPLPSILMSRSMPSAVGDMMTALVFWTVFADCTVGELLQLVLVASAAGIVNLSTVTIINCIPFWMPTVAPLSEEIVNVFLMMATYPHHPFGFVVRLFLFSVFPTAFIALLPVEAVREASAIKAFGVVVAAVFYSWLATVVFDRGLRRYSSGNRILERR